MGRAELSRLRLAGLVGCTIAVACTAAQMGRASDDSRVAPAEDAGPGPVMALAARFLPFVAWSASGRYVLYVEEDAPPADASGYASHSLGTLDVVTGQRCTIARCVWCNGREITAWFGDQVVLVSETGLELQAPCSGHIEELSGAIVQIVAAAPDGHRFVTVARERYQLVDVLARTVTELEAPIGADVGISWSPAGDRIAVTSKRDMVGPDFTIDICIIDTTTGRPDRCVVEQRPAGEGRLDAPAWIGERAVLVSMATSTGPYVWSWNDEEGTKWPLASAIRDARARRLRTLRATALRQSEIHDNSFILLGDQEGGFAETIILTGDADRLSEWSVSGEIPQGIALPDPTGAQIAVMTFDGESRQYVISVGRVDQGVTLRPIREAVSHVLPVWSTDGHSLAFARAEVGVCRFSLTTQAIDACDDSGDGRPVAWSPDGNRLIVTDAATSYVWTLPATHRWRGLLPTLSRGALR